MPSPTWDRLAPARRDAVLTAAEQEFSAHGFANASLNRIAQHAGVAKGSLFQYFVDKADLYVHVTRLSSHRVRAAMTERASRLDWDGDFFLALDDLVGFWVSYFFDHPLERGLTAASSLEMDPDARRAVRGAVDGDYLDVIGPLVGVGLRSGALPADTDVPALHAALVLALPHLALAPHVVGLDPVLDLHGSDREAACATARRVVRQLMR